MTKKLRIVRDQSPESPRTWDCLSKILLSKSSRWNFADETFESGSFDSLEEHLESLKQDEDNVYACVLYGYSHGGLMLSLSPFGDRFDSGVIGFLVVEKERVSNFFTEEPTEEKIEKILASEIKVLNQWLEGDVWGYEVFEVCGDCGSEKDVVDSCWGFFGEDQDSIKEHLDEEMVKQFDEAWRNRR